MSSANEEEVSLKEAYKEREQWYSSLLNVGAMTILFALTAVLLVTTTGFTFMSIAAIVLATLGTAVVLHSIYQARAWTEFIASEGGSTRVFNPKANSLDSAVFYMGE